MSSPSARPPANPRRPPDLDSRQAREFVDRAASHPANPTSDGRDGVGINSRADSASSAPLRKEQLRPLTLRIPEQLHTNLLYIAENGNRSMNQFVIDALAPAVDAQMEKIARRKELGLD